MSVLRSSANQSFALGIWAYNEVTAVTRPTLRKNASWLVVLVPLLAIVGLIWKAQDKPRKPSISFFRAVALKDAKAVQWYIAADTPINGLAPGGHTALFTAAGSNSPEIVKLLLDAGASPNAEQRGKQTPLMNAALAGDFQTFNDLVAHGAELNVVSADGGTPLHSAAAGGNPQIVEFLLDKGLNIEARRKVDGATPICDAASGGHAACIELLAKRGAGIDARGYNDRTPLSLTIVTQHPEVAKSLIELGANPNLPDKDGIKPINFAFIRREYDIARLLIPKTKDLNSFGRAGYNVVQQAVNYNAPVALVKELLDRGCSPDQKTSGFWPLAIAMQRGDTEMVELLKKAGAHEGKALSIKR
jgi:cytohesin